MDAPLSVYYEVVPATLGRVMYRINRALKRHAPAWVRFVTSPGLADLQILDAVGIGCFEHLRCRRFVLLMHTWKTSWGGTVEWLPHFRQADLVVSYHDLPSLVKDASWRFLRLPWGVDGEVFRPRGMTRTHAVLTTGYDDGQEAIRECHEAARRLGAPSVHLNARFPWMWPGLDVVDGINDEALATWYSRCWYVSGLRRIEGFELPVLEGLCCGARPIVFDTPTAREWFDGHAIFVPEVEPAALTDVLTEVLRESPRFVTADERATVLDRFGWTALAARFWAAIWQAVMVTA